MLLVALLRVIWCLARLVLSVIWGFVSFRCIPKSYSFFPFLYCIFRCVVSLLLGFHGVCALLSCLVVVGILFKLLFKLLFRKLLILECWVLHLRVPLLYGWLASIVGLVLDSVVAVHYVVIFFSVGLVGVSSVSSWALWFAIYVCGM